MASTLGKTTSNNNNNSISSSSKGLLIVKKETEDTGQKANSVTDRDGWWYDTGATSHTCNDKSQFRTYRECTNLRIRVANGAYVEVLGRGNVDLKFTSGQVLTLVDVRHAPGIVKNLISGGRINKTGVKLVIEADSLILSRNNVIIGKGNYYSGNGLFRMDLMKSNPCNDVGVAAATQVKNLSQEMQHSGIWDSEKSAAQGEGNSPNSLASIYRRPFNLMYKGSFDEAKQEAERQDKWMIVNLQSTKDFDSHMLNRDTWSNEVLADIISANFIFWQAQDDDTIEVKTVCNYYNLVSLPVVLVLDPITGEKAQLWSGMIQTKRLLEKLLPFMDTGPKSHHVERPSKCQKLSSQTE